MIHYNSSLTYQKDSKFVAVGINSIERMQKLKEAGGYTFVLKDFSGFVFNTRELKDAKDGDNILPVMVVKFRKSPINGWMQAHGLRIRETFADEAIAKAYYFEYVKQVGPLISDNHHLHGGYMLWKHFLKHGDHPNFKITSWNYESGQVVDQNLNISNIEEASLWSEHPDQTLKNLVLSLEYVPTPTEARRDSRDPAESRSCPTGQAFLLLADMMKAERQLEPALKTLVETVNLAEKELFYAEKETLISHLKLKLCKKLDEL